MAPDETLASAADSGDPAAEAVVTSARMQHAADSLRHWQHRILDWSVLERDLRHGRDSQEALSDEVPLWDLHAVRAGEAANLEALVAWAQTSADALAILKPAAERRKGWRGWQYNVTRMIEVMALLPQIRSANALRVTLAKTIDYLFASPVANALKSDLEGPTQHVPSQATISRYRLYVDVAFMLVKQQQHQAALATGHAAAYTRYMKVDASPLRGVDWLNTEVVCLSQEVLLEASRSQKQLILARSLDTEDADDDVMQPGPNLARHSMSLLSAFTVHTLPPAGVAGGAAGLVNKAEAFLHQISLEAGHSPDSLQAYLATVAGLCTDLGTEHLLANVPSVHLAAILPKLEHQGFIRTEEDSELLSSSASVPVQEPVAFQAPLQPLSSDHGKLFLLPNCLFIPGILHITHNALQDMCHLLSRYKAYVTDLTQVSDWFLRRDCREYFVARLVLTSPEGQWFRHLFENRCGIKTRPHAQRFLTTAEATAQVLELEVPLRRFLRPGSADAVPASGQRDDSVDDKAAITKRQLEVVANIVARPAFWTYAKLIQALGGVCEQFSHMGESCLCHPTPPDLRGESLQKRRGHYEEELLGRTMELAACESDLPNPQTGSPNIP